MISVATSVILYAAAKELNAVSTGETLQSELQDDALEMLNNILDDANAERGKVYADSFLPFTIQVAHGNPTTIGPTAADWTMTQRPVDIEGIQVLLSGGTPVPYVFLRKRDAAWWQRQPSPTVTASFPTDFFYDPTWTTAAPNGSVFLFPVPTTAYAVQVWTRIILGQLTVAQTISLPPGYNYWLRMELASRLSGPWRKPWTPKQETERVRAVSVIEGNNVVVPRIQTRDSGMPSSGGRGLPTYFWPDGSIR